MISTPLNSPERNLYTATIAGAHCLVTESRIRRDTVPEGYHIYHIRHADDNQDAPCTLEKQCVVNFWGTVIADREIPFPDGQDYYTLTEEEIDNLALNEDEWDAVQESRTHDVEGMVKDFLELYPPITG